MLQETMSKIKAAEDEAAQIIRDSEVESRKIIEAAKDSAEKKKQAIFTADKENLVKLQELEQTQRENEIQSSLTEADEEVMVLKQQIQGKEDKAMDLVISLLA